MINPISNSPVQKVVTQPVQKQLPAEPAKQLQATDRLEVSGVSVKSVSGDGIRADLVARIKQELDAGTYETPIKLAISVDRMLKDVT